MATAVASMTTMAYRSSARRRTHARVSTSDQDKPKQEVLHSKVLSEGKQTATKHGDETAGTHLGEIVVGCAGWLLLKDLSRKSSLTH